MSAPNWRTFPHLVRLYQGREFNQANLDYLWDYAEAVHQALPLFMLAILPHENTGSWNTSAENPAADGGHGPEADWEKDVCKAVDLVAGKLCFYKQAVQQGFISIAKAGPPGGDGLPDQLVNWHMPILRQDGTIDGGVYALHASWWRGVRNFYLEMGGTLPDLILMARALDNQAPRVKFQFRVVNGELRYGSNWNGTTAETTVITERLDILPATQLIPVELLDGQTLHLPLRDGTTYVEAGDHLLPLRDVVKSLGAGATYTGAEAGGPRVKVTAPARSWWGRLLP